MNESNALDATLDALGAQRVPPEFYHSEHDDEASSLFGSQHSDDDEISTSPSSAVRVLPPKATKTLRDFIADRAVDEIYDTLDNERNELDDVIEQTTDFPTVLRNTIDAIERTLPQDSPTDIYVDLERQEETISDMAKHLESLTQHYDQMASALQDSERGEAFDEVDLQGAFPL